MSVYKVIEIIGTSTESWEDAGLTAVKKARETIRNLRVAEVLEQDLDLDDSGGPRSAPSCGSRSSTKTRRSAPHCAAPPRRSAEHSGHGVRRPRRGRGHGPRRCSDRTYGVQRAQ